MKRREVRYPGTVASKGLATGSLYLDSGVVASQRTRGTPEQERTAFLAAIDGAREALQSLAARSGAAGEEILEVQIAFLEDEDLIEPIVARIADGAAADGAWASAMDAQIDEYAGSEDDYFRARASDLADLRERVLRALSPDADGDTGMPGPGPEPGPLVLVAADLTPSRFLELDWTRFGGAALVAGSTASHVAMLARARGVPLMIGLQAELASLEAGGPAILDAEKGWLAVDPEAETHARFAEAAEARVRTAAQAAQFLPRPALTAGGTPITVTVNIDDPAIVEAIEPGHCDGIGLARTEFLFSGAALPDEETQFRAYARLVEWAGGKPVTIRTLDAGGDKPIAGLTPENETNPFLGVRGVRLSLARPEIFRIQLRALARASALGPVKVMCPMVTVPEEMEAVRALIEAVVAELSAEGIACALPALGMMVEVPAAAMNAADFAIAFYSIGTNDLTQYVTATARDNAAVSSLHDPSNPAVLALIGQVVAAGRADGREVSLCGEMASNPDLLPVLLSLGLRSLSVAPAALAGVKAAIATWHG